MALIERFRCIDAAMRDLPVYNRKVAVEAIGSRPFGDDALLGVVLTPWFTNVLTLPKRGHLALAAVIGSTVRPAESHMRVGQFDAAAVTHVRCSRRTCWKLASPRRGRPSVSIAEQRAQERRVRLVESQAVN
ncbi:MAG: [NiFe]-hydrogenase assembly chaperone HybE [Beijerinckiaceae bacterium]